MYTDHEEQEDELLALQSIFSSEEFVRDESKSAGEIRVSVELSADFTVVLKEGETLTQYEISFLPPLLLNFELPEDYPSSSPPSFTLTCTWLTHTHRLHHLVSSLQLSALTAQLTDLYEATGGAVVLFTWVQFLKEDALRFLDIHTLLELPFDEHRTQDCSQDSSHAAPSEPKHNEPASEAAREAEQTLQTSELKPDNYNDLSSAAGTSEPLSVPQSDQIGQEDPLNEGTVSASISSDTLDESEQGAAPPPTHPREPPPNEDQTLSGLSLTPSQTLMSQLLIYNAEQKQKQFETTVFDCGVCFVGWLGSDCKQLPECGHIFCQACLAQLYKLQITEGNIKGVTCPEADCTATPTPAQVRSLVGEELFSRYDRLLLQNTLDCMPDVAYCPRRSCGSVVIREKSGTAAMCSVCSFAFCVICKKTYHGAEDCQGMKNMKKQTAEDVQQDHLALPVSEEGLKALWDDYASGSKQRRQLLESRYSRNRLLFTVEEGLSENWIADNAKTCPHCFRRIQKDGGCNVMTCSRCRQRFCWACLTKLSSVYPGRHFEDSASCSVYQY